MSQQTAEKWKTALYTDLLFLFSNRIYADLFADFYRAFFNTKYQEALSLQNTEGVNEVLNLQAEYSDLISFVEGTVLESRFEFNQGTHDIVSLTENIEMALSKVRRWDINGYIKANGEYRGWTGYLSCRECVIDFLLCINFKKNASNDFDVKIEFLHSQIPEHSFKFDFFEWRKLIPIIDYYIRADYSAIDEKRRCIQMMRLTDQRVKQMNESALCIFVKHICEQRKLQFSITSDFRGSVVKIKLPRRLCLRFRVHDDDLHSVIKELPEKIDEALDFINRGKVLCSIQFYASSELWQDK